MATGLAVPKPSLPYTGAAVDQAMAAAQAQFGAQLNNMSAQFEQFLANMCARGDAAAGVSRMPYSGAATPPPPQQPFPQPLPNPPGPWFPPGGPKPGCGCGGSGSGCGGKCGDCMPPQCLPPGKDPPPGWFPPDGGYGGGNPCLPMSPGGVPRGNVPLLFQLAPACYDCACLDPCLYPALQFARNMFDPWQWTQAYQNDGSLVHLDVNAGDAPDFNANLVPIANNTESLFGQQFEQVLPYIAGLIKIDVQWSGTPAPGQVNIQFYTGPNPVVANGVTTTQQLDAAPFAKAGRAYKLTDFECKDQCYVQPFVRIFNCTPGPITFNRAMYARVSAVALPGNTTITSMTVTLIKQGTPQYVNCCSEFKIPPVGLKYNQYSMNVDSACKACGILG